MQVSGLEEETLDSDEKSYENRERTETKSMKEPSWTCLASSPSRPIPSKNSTA